MKIESTTANDDATNDIEFEFQDDSEDDDEEADDVSHLLVRLVGRWSVIYINRYLTRKR